MFTHLSYFSINNKLKIKIFAPDPLPNPSVRLPPLEEFSPLLLPPVSYVPGIFIYNNRVKPPVLAIRFISAAVKTLLNIATSSTITFAYSEVGVYVPI